MKKVDKERDVMSDELESRMKEKDVMSGVLE